MTIVAENMGLAYPGIVRGVIDHGHESSPRGQKIRENLGFHLYLTNPAQCLVNRPNFNRALMWADILSVVGGTFNDSVYDAVSAKSTRALHKRSGAYGPRTAAQIDEVIAELIRDPDSRRAIVYIGRDNDLRSSVDIADMPCTSVWQFFIRNSRLEMITYMRSWDLVWGLSYDLPVFTSIQRAVAAALRIEIGSYQHFAGSAHVYERHFEDAMSFEAVETPELHSIVEKGSISYFAAPELKLMYPRLECSHVLSDVASLWVDSYSQSKRPDDTSLFGIRSSHPTRMFEPFADILSRMENKIKSKES